MGPRSQRLWGGKRRQGWGSAYKVIPSGCRTEAGLLSRLAGQSCDGMGIRADSPSDPAPGPALAKWTSAPCEPHTRHGPAWLFELIDLVGEGA